MKNPDPFSHFLLSYGLNPIDDKIFTQLKQVQMRIQERIEDPHYSGQIRLKSRYRYELMKQIASGTQALFPSQFGAENTINEISIRKGLELVDLLKTISIARTNLLPTIDEEKSFIWQFINQLTFADTRAIAQAGYGDTKKRRVRDLQNQVEIRSPPELEQVAKFIKNKVPSTTFYLWSKNKLKLTHSHLKSRYVYKFTNKRKYHYIPLYGSLTSPRNSLKGNILIVENLDTAIALGFLRDYHSYSIITCAGGGGNLGTDFVEGLRNLNNLNPAEWLYFGDYDIAGLQIFKRLQERIKGALQDNLKPILLNSVQYLKYLMLFGKPVPKEKWAKKKALYLKFLENPNLEEHIAKICRHNLKYRRELEQNLLIYARKPQTNELLIS